MIDVPGGRVADDRTAAVCNRDVILKLTDEATGRAWLKGSISRCFRITLPRSPIGLVLQLFLERATG